MNQITSYHHNVLLSYAKFCIHKCIYIPLNFSFFTKYGDPLSIDGPSTFADKIAIVGAGASGIDMAAKLKKLGFTSIDIYERENRIGGKSMTTRDPEGTIQDLGSCCIGPGYEDNVMDIIENYAPNNSLVPRQFGSVWLDDKDNPIPYPEYVMREIKCHFQTNSPDEAMRKLTKLVDNYTTKHRQLFGTYDYELMPRPSEETLKELNCSYWTFLKRNELDGLRPILLLTHTLQGYGYLDEIGAFYGMMWNTPFFMQSLLALASGQKTPSKSYISRLIYCPYLLFLSIVLIYCSYLLFYSYLLFMQLFCMTVVSLKPIYLLVNSIVP